MRSSGWVLASWLTRVTTLLLLIAPAVPQDAILRAQAAEEAPPKRPHLNLVGDAEIFAKRLRLTPASRQTVGAAWLSEKKYVAGGFEAVFRFQITEPGGLGPGADGFAFVLQNHGPDAIAGRGSAGGFSLSRDLSEPAIPRSIAVFFDTFQNDDALDPSSNYIAVCTNGPMPNMRWPPSRLGVGRKLKVRLKDGRVHEARVRYKPPVITVSLDNGDPEIRVPVDLRTVVDASGYAYVGFTASTGNGYENHDILDWSFTPAIPDVSSDITLVQSNITYSRTSCLEGRNLCTPPEAIVEENGPGQYHVILPAHLPWGAGIPNPGARPVTVTNRKGNVCLDSKALEQCSGPDGMATGTMGDKDRASLIDPDRNPGALIVKTDRGQTLFSVNGRKGRAFTANEGFFEFDVTLK
jgi:hypothetical protein